LFLSRLAIFAIPTLIWIIKQTSRHAKSLKQNVKRTVFIHLAECE
jgi:hypothetical protein